MTDRANIYLRCDRCGNATIVPRRPEDPRHAVELELGSCPICEVAGEWEQAAYRDANGEEIQCL